MTTLGLDIGGANIKAADSAGNAISIPFRLWQFPSELGNVLENRVLSRFANWNHLALTMTGELCDCFESKHHGVRHILESVLQVVNTTSLHVYGVNGQFAQPEEVRLDPLRFAASNWHALANFSRRLLSSSSVESPQAAALLVDTGTTSTDLVPLTADAVLARGSTDPTRIANRELVYTGFARSPVCAVCPTVLFRGQHVELAQELFATMQDVYVVLGWIPENPGQDATADGRSLTLDHSKRRLAKTLCADLEELTNEEIQSVAHQAFESQLKTIIRAIDDQQSALNREFNTMIASGSGVFLLERIRPRLTRLSNWISIQEVFGTDLSQAAPAYASAMLLEEACR